MLEEHVLSPLFLEVRHRRQFSRSPDNLSLFFSSILEIAGRNWPTCTEADRKKKSFF
jgi:hypothetical protein